MAVYTVVCLAFMSRPVVLVDEAQFADPAANLYFHGKFQTSVWPYQTLSEVFFGNAPLYSLLLGFWYHVAGFGLFQTRIPSWIFACAGIIWSLAALERSALLKGNYRFALVLLFLTGTGLSENIWTARYDTLGFAILAALLFGLSAKGTRSGDITRWLALALVPLAGFHLVLVVLFLYAALVWARHSTWRGARSDLAVMAAGGLMMLAYYSITVGLKRFVFLTLFSNHTVLGQAARATSRGFTGFLSTKGAGVLAVFTQDPAYLVVLAATVSAIAYILYRNHGRTRMARGEIALAAGAILLPILLSLVGKYPLYYSWIGWSCLCVLFLTVLSRLEWNGARCAAAIAAVFLISCHVSVAAYLRERLAPAPIEVYRAGLHAAIDREARPGEIFYSDMTTYFDVWRRAGHVYAYTYAQNRFLPGFPTPSPVTMIVTQKQNLANVEKLVGGSWRCVWRSPAAQGAASPEIDVCKRL